MERHPHDPGTRLPPINDYGYRRVDVYELERQARRMQADAMAEMIGALWRSVRRLARRITTDNRKDRQTHSYSGRANG